MKHHHLNFQIKPFLTDLLVSLKQSRRGQSCVHSVDLTLVGNQSRMPDVFQCETLVAFMTVSSTGDWGTLDDEALHNRWLTFRLMRL